MEIKSRTHAPMLIKKIKKTGRPRDRPYVAAFMVSVIARNTKGVTLHQKREHKFSISPCFINFSFFLKKTKNLFLEVLQFSGMFHPETVTQTRLP